MIKVSIFFDSIIFSA